MSGESPQPRRGMGKQRLEAFSDGVLAIIITIMVLELKVPHGSDLHALAPVWPIFLSYVLSFVYVGIYWNNHHHLLHASRLVSGGVLWANLGLLFFLSLIPVVTGWVGDHPHAPWPVAFYGLVLALSGLAWTVLQRRLIALNGPDSEVAQAMGKDWKGKISLLLYLAGIGISFLRPWVAQSVYAVVALMWIIPDRRIESRLGMPETPP